MQKKRNINIRIPVLTRVEGEGALELTIKQNKIETLQLQIFEPPRYFEKVLEGRGCDEALDMVSRICGICPVAYQMTATQAMESIFDLKPTAWIRQMRELFYCGEWITSHSMHINLLSGPDFLGCTTVMELAKQAPQAIRYGMHLQGLGNQIIEFLGKRSVHPVGARIGGFSRAPTIKSAKKLLADLEKGLESAEKYLEWVAGFSFPDDDQKFISVALHHHDYYAMSEGTIKSDHGLDISIDEFQQYFREEQVPYSTALQCTLQGKPYLVGPLARMNLNHERLPEFIKIKLNELAIQWPSKNMFHSILARAVEIYFALHKAITILKEYYLPKSSKIPVNVKAGIGYGCTEAPRGILWHRYEIDNNGLVKNADLVPPTSQNQRRIEEDLLLSLQKFGLDRDEKELKLHAEKVIRNYDPCISCAAHFLDLRVTRS